MRYKVAYIILGILLTAVCVFVMSLPSAYPQNAAEEELKAATPTAIAEPAEEGGFSSTLPLLCIENDNTQIEYGEPGWCDISVIDNAGGLNHPGDEPAIKTASTIWVRGQSSALFDKKSYGIEFFKKRDSDKKSDTALLGMAEGHDWILHGPYLDKSLVRNRLTYHLAREMMFWAPDTRYCEVFLNGEYQGIYLIIESPRVYPGRIELADYALLSGETPYLLQRNRAGTDTTEVSSFGLYSGKTRYPVYVRYPVDDKLTEKQLLWISSDFSEFERALYSDYFLDEKKGYKSYIDMDSFVAYYILTEFSINKDSGFLSTYYCKDIDGKLMMGPVWDFNNGYDNYNGYMSPPDGGFEIADNNWFGRITQDRAFVDAVVNKYRELRKGILSTDAIMEYLDKTEAYLGDAINRNFERWAQSFNWSYLGKDDDGFSRDIKSYAEARKKLRIFITERGEYLDKNIELLYNNCIN